MEVNIEITRFIVEILSTEKILKREPDKDDRAYICKVRWNDGHISLISKKYVKKFMKKDYYCPSCFRHSKKKYQMKQIQDCFGQESYECKHCHHAYVKYSLIQELNKLGDEEE